MPARSPAPDGLRIVVTDTQKRAGDVFAHIGTVEAGRVAVGAAVVAELDHRRRGDIGAHHSATHLLHEALRRRLGTHVQQKGSLNAPDRLRFDVSQPTPIAKADLQAVEAEVNARIRENTAVTTRLMTPEAAVAEGAMALFGEKYGDEVRVVAMGEGGDERTAYSIELCGGTHVRRTGDIGLFRLLGEGAVSAGVRRIEAVTGPAALALIGESERRIEEVAGLLKSSPADVPARVATLIEDRKRLEKQVSELQRKLATGVRRAGTGGDQRHPARCAQRGRGARQGAARPGGGHRQAGRQQQRGGGGVHGGGQGQHRGGRHGRPGEAGECGGPGARGQHRRRRQGRRRPAGHGAGRRP